MIRVLIDEISAQYDRHDHHRQRLYVMEILNAIDIEDGTRSYSVHVQDSFGREVKHCHLPYPATDVLKLVTDALKEAQDAEGND